MCCCHLVFDTFTNTYCHVTWLKPQTGRLYYGIHTGAHRNGHVHGTSNWDNNQAW